MPPGLKGLHDFSELILRKLQKTLIKLINRIVYPQFTEFKYVLTKL